MGDRPVLFVSYAGLAGGAERVLLDCAVRLGRPAVVACPEGPLAADARAAGLAVEALPERPLRLRGAAVAHGRGLAALARDSRRLAREHDPVVLVAWGARAVLATALGRGGPPSLAVHHDLLPRGAVAAAVRAASRRAAGEAAASETVARGLRRSGAGEVLVLRPGVDLAAWTPAPLPPAAPPRALVLGALVPWKRADLALEVAALVPELRLTLAGAPLPGDPDDYAARLRRRADQPDLRGRVELAGHLDDPRPALAAAHVLLHCADAEPWGLALIEALAAGRPVVAPAAGGPREIVGDGTPAHGRLFAPGDAGAAARALHEVLQDPEAAAAAARRHAESAFAVEASAARFAAWLESFAR